MYLSPSDHTPTPALRAASSASLYGLIFKSFGWPTPVYLSKDSFDHLKVHILVVNIDDTKGTSIYQSSDDRSNLI